MKKAARRIINQMTTDAQKLIEGYKEQYHGITDDEARQLAHAFIDLWSVDTVLTEKKRKYEKAHAAMKQKYASGEFKLIDLEPLDSDLLLLEDMPGIPLLEDMPLLDDE